MTLARHFINAIGYRYSRCAALDCGMYLFQKDGQFRNNVFCDKHKEPIMPPEPVQLKMAKLKVSDRDNFEGRLLLLLSDYVPGDTPYGEVYNLHYALTKLALGE
jgi:hypothetical protein